MSYRDMWRVFGRIGLLSFGGPASQIALMHKELVETRQWLSEDQFLKALSFCMLLPGPEAMQLATYAGWRQKGVIGGLIAGGLFVVPGALIIAALALLYSSIGNVAWMQALFIGVQATVVVIVIEALIKVSKRALRGRGDIAIAILAFIALFAFDAPFPLIILIAGLWGAWQSDGAKATAPPKTPHNPLRIIAIGGVLWAAPLVALWAMDHALLTQIGLFFSKLAVVTFGGAYAVLAYMTQEVVGHHGWLSTDQMMDALGLAETTPGPLILVTQFVAMLTGFAQGGPWFAITAGLLTLWVTFVPCFIWIFAGAPLIDWLDTQPRLRSALAAITAAVVGVIANLSIWFAAHVFFAQVNQLDWGPLRMIWPDLTGLQILPAALALIAGYLMLIRHWGLLVVLGLMAVTSVLAQPLFTG